MRPLLLLSLFLSRCRPLISISYAPALFNVAMFPFVGPWSAYPLHQFSSVSPFSILCGPLIRIHSAPTLFSIAMFFPLGPAIKISSAPAFFIVVIFLSLWALDQYIICVCCFHCRHVPSVVGPSSVYHLRPLVLLSQCSFLCGPLINISYASAFFLVAMLLFAWVIDMYTLCVRSMYCRYVPPVGPLDQYILRAHSVLSPLSFWALGQYILCVRSAPALFTVAISLPM